MGKLVPFDRRGKGRPATARPEGPVTAEILLFTGVRYERGPSVKPTKPTASSGGKRTRG